MKRKRVKEEAKERVIKPGAPLRTAIPIELLTDPHRFDRANPHILEAVAAGILDSQPAPQPKKRKAASHVNSAASLEGGRVAKRVCVEKAEPTT